MQWARNETGQGFAAVAEHDSQSSCDLVIGMASEEGGVATSGVEAGSMRALLQGKRALCCNSRLQLMDIELEYEGLHR